MDRWGLRVWAEGLVLHRGREGTSEMGKERCRWVQENVGEPEKETEGPAVDEWMAVPTDAGRISKVSTIPGKCLAVCGDYGAGGSGSQMGIWGG